MGQEEDMIMKKGPWTEEEDVQLVSFVNMCGDRRWDFVAKVSGLRRSGKSCRLRWVNYLHPGLKRGKMTHQEECLILELHTKWGNRWSKIARKLPGRTDNEIKNYWRTHMRKKAQEKKTALSSSPSVSNSSAYSTTTSNPTVDSIPMTETKDINSYDARGLEMVMKSSTTSVSNTSDVQKGYDSMDEIWKDITLSDDGITSVLGAYSEITSPSIWDYSLSTLWMNNAQEEIGSSMCFTPTTSEQSRTRLSG